MTFDSLVFFKAGGVSYRAKVRLGRVKALALKTPRGEWRAVGRHHYLKGIDSIDAVKVYPRERFIQRPKPKSSFEERFGTRAVYVERAIREALESSSRIP